MTAAAATGATAARLALGWALSRLRQDAQMSLAAASAVTGVPAQVIGEIERGQVRPRIWDIAGLYPAYRLDDLDRRSTLLGLAFRAGSAEWWHSYRDVIPGWLERYLGLEQACKLIRGYSPHQVPDLLQTADYAREAIAAARPAMTRRDAGRRLDLRLRRQEILRRPAPARLWTVIDEAALRRPAASRTVMRGQLAHLIEMCDLPHVTIGVLPFSLGALPEAAGPLSVLRLPDCQLPDVAVVEHVAGAQYYAGTNHLDYFRHVLNHLCLSAGTAGPPQRLLTEILKET